MKKLTALFTLGCALAVDAHAGIEKYGPHNLDGGHITCKSFSGDEIKKTAVYKAPSDRFFVEKSIAVNVLSGWAPKKHGCDLAGVTKKDVTLQSEAGPVEVSVVTEFSAYAYADCGTDPARFLGKTAAIECTVQADMAEYKK